MHINKLGNCEGVMVKYLSYDLYDKSRNQFDADTLVEKVMCYQVIHIEIGGVCSCFIGKNIQ